MQTVIRCRVSCQPICPHSIPRPRLCSASPARDGQATQSVSRRHRSLRCLAIATRGVLVPDAAMDQAIHPLPIASTERACGTRGTRHTAEAAFGRLPLPGDLLTKEIDLCKLIRLRRVRAAQTKSFLANMPRGRDRPIIQARPRAEL